MKGSWPKDFLKSVFASIEKEKNAVSCKDLQTIGLTTND